MLPVFSYSSNRLRAEAILSNCGFLGSCKRPYLKAPIIRRLRMYFSNLGDHSVSASSSMSGSKLTLANTESRICWVTVLFVIVTMVFPKVPILSFGPRNRVIFCFCTISASFARLNGTFVIIHNSKTTP